MMKPFLMKKLILSFLCIALMFIQHTIAQNVSDEIKERWANIISDLNRKNDLVGSLTNYLSEVRFKGNDKLGKMKTAIVNCQKLLDTVVLENTKTVSAVASRSLQLSKAIDDVMSDVEQQASLKQKQQFHDLLRQLEGTENRIHVAINEYNTGCRKAKRFDLIFPSIGISRSPEVKF